MAKSDLHVLQAFTCSEIRDTGRMRRDFVGVHELVELPGDGTALDLPPRANNP
jgi:hypothetical protein